MEFRSDGDFVGFILKRGSGLSFGLLLMLAGLSCGNFPVLDVDTNMRIVLVPYDTPVGTIIYRLRASDSDNNFPLSFEVLGSIGKSILSLRFLGCDLTESLCQADVVLKKALDKGRTYEFQLQVKDTVGDYTKVHSVIQGTQGTANFNPTFMPKIIHLDENTPVGTELEKFVIAKTRLNSRHVLLEIRDKGDRIALRQRLVSNNQTEGSLLLKKALDYETEPWFTFQLLAMNAYTNTTSDTRNILVSQVIVAVHDVQDTPPFFTSLPASVQIKSSMRPGDLIATVRAEDGDKQNKRLIRYGFLTDANPFVVFFNLDPMSGEIHLRRNLSELLTMAKPNEPIGMTIVAEEIIPDSGRLSKGKAYDGNSKALGKITFWFGQDSSFGPAHFSSDKYVGEIKENSVSGSLVNFGSNPRVTHEHKNELISLSIQPGGTSNKIYSKSNDLSESFHILPTQGSGNFSFEIRVKDGKMLDYEQVKEVTFLVVAITSCGASSESQVTIHIRDENDEIPIFSQQEYHVELQEHPQKGQRVVQVQAEDKDSGNNGKISYYNLVGSNAFRLDPMTGEITVERPELIDRETEPEIRLYVEAKDGGYQDNLDSTSSRNLATTTVLIKLQDKNDNAPKFLQKYYQAVFNPQLTELKNPLFLKAFDPDEGLNAQIRYEVKDKRFFVDPLSGEFRLRGAFIRDPRDGDGPFIGTVKVYAYDLGNPRQMGEAQVQLFSEEMVTREIQFVFPASPDKIKRNKTNFEIMLSKLSGGVAHIQEITPYHRYPRAGLQVDGSSGELETTPESGSEFAVPDRFKAARNNQEVDTNPLNRRSAELATSDKSLVTATVQYPVSATPTRVDLSQIPNVYGTGGEPPDKGGGDGGPGQDQDKIRVYEAENRALFWILISFLMILVILFAIFVCCVYCPWCWLYGHCYSKGDKMREGSGRSLLLETCKRRHSDAHSRHKVDEEEYDRDYRRGPPKAQRSRREAWSGDERKSGWRGGPHQSPRSMRRYRGTPPRRGKVGPQPHEQDVALEDWEFEGPHPRGRDQAEEIGSRWQLQQQQSQANLQQVPQGSQMMPMPMPVAVPMQQQPRRVAFGQSGEGEYMRRSQEIYPEGPYRGQQQQGQDSAMSHLQQRKTRFFRTETGEVLQFGDYDGDDGKQELMKRYIDEQQPDQYQRQQSFGSQNRVQTPPPGNQSSQPELRGEGGVDRPKAAIVSRRHQKSVSLNKDVTFEDSPKLARSDSKKKSKRRSPSYESGGDEIKQEEMRRGKESDKKQKREKSTPPISEDESRRSRSPTRRSYHQSHSRSKEKTKSPSRSKTQSMSPPPRHSKSKSPSRSKSRTRSRSITPPEYDKKKHKKQGLDHTSSKHKLRRHHHIQQSKASTNSKNDDDYKSHKLKHKDSKSRSRDEISREKSKSLDPSLTSIPSLRTEDSELPQTIEDSPRKSQSRSPSLEDDSPRRPSLFKQQSSEDLVMNQSMVDINVIPPSSAMTDSSYNAREDDPKPDDRREDSVESESYQYNEVKDTIPEREPIASQSTLDIAEAEAEAAAAIAPNSIDDQQDTPAADQLPPRDPEDDDSGIGMAGYLSRRNKMLEKKSVFTIAYDEVAQSGIMRPETRGSTAEAIPDAEVKTQPN